MPLKIALLAVILAAPLAFAAPQPTKEQLVRNSCASAADVAKHFLTRRLNGGILHETLKDIEGLTLDEHTKAVMSTIAIEMERAPVPAKFESEGDKVQFISAATNRFFLACYQDLMKSK